MKILKLIAKKLTTDRASSSATTLKTPPAKVSPMNNEKFAQDNLERRA